MNNSIKRKRNVFGQKISSRGVIVLIVLEIGLITFLYFFLSRVQNDLIETESELVDHYNSEIVRLNSLEIDSQIIQNIGDLIPTLPTSFVQQECSLDIDRIKNMSDVLGTNPDYEVDMEYPIPLEFTEGSTDDQKLAQTTQQLDAVKTLEIVKIEFTITTNDINKLLTFINYLTNYENERFFYIAEIDIIDIGIDYSTDGTAEFIVYTFYNNVDIQE